MKQRGMAAVLVGLIWASAAFAQEAAWQFRWQKGQVLTYKAEHKMSVEEIADGAKTASSSKLNLVKRWQVVDADAQGSATLHLSMLSMRNEQTRPSGEVVLFDSANPDKSTLELRDQMSKFIGPTLAILRIDAQGRILEVKQGNASRYEAEPPFAVVFPAAAPKEGQAWLRNYSVTTGGSEDKLEATQRCQCLKIAVTTATLQIANQFKALPESVKDQVPLLQNMAEGQATFDIRAGRLEAVQLTVDRMLMNHQGAGSSYRFQSWYVEQLVEGK